ncbi:MAG: flavodoxin family protein [Chloroflexota bacterium]|nr:flavodoxin family protein [Chloroflexota bacterium]
MKVVVVYDSLYGNTENIARAIGDAIAGEAKVVRVGEVSLSELESVDLLVVGSPTQGGRPTLATRDLLNKVSKSAVKGVKVAAFDTRVPARWAAIFGYAAGRIARTLKRKGGTLVASPEGFFVEGTKGPLKEGELERAAAWARGIAK